MPRRRDRHKEPKDQNLQHQPPHDDILPPLHSVPVLRLHQHAGSPRLDEETEDVACDEDLGDPGGAHEGVGGGVGAEDEAAEDHVDGGGEEDGGDEDEDGLDDVGDFVGEVGVGGCAGAVADGFELGGGWVSGYIEGVRYGVDVLGGCFWAGFLVRFCVLKYWKEKCCI